MHLVHNPACNKWFFECDGCGKESNLLSKDLDELLGSWLTHLRLGHGMTDQKPGDCKCGDINNLDSVAERLNKPITNIVVSMANGTYHSKNVCE